MKNSKLISLATTTALLMASFALPIYANAEINPANDWAYSDTYISAEFEKLNKLGIFEGDPDGDFRPYDSITRAESATVLAKVLGATDIAVINDTGFSDVDSTCFASGYIKQLKDKNIINGDEYGLYNPNESLSFNEFIKIVIGIIEDGKSDCIGFSYPDDYINKAKELKILDRVYNEDIDYTDHIVLRLNVAIILNNAYDLSLITPLPSLENVPQVEGVNTFAMNMNGEMSKTQNYMFSPLSVKMAMAMTANGADGNTKDEILSVLGIDNLDEYNKATKKLIEDYNNNFDYDDYNALVDKLNSGKREDGDFEKLDEYRKQLRDGETTVLNIANSIWLNQDYYQGYDVKFKDEFEDIIKTDYLGTSNVVNNSNAVKTINDWTSSKTNGKITEIIKDSDFISALVNAIYFNGKWANDFSETKTKDDTFTNADGTDVLIPFMNQTTYFNHYKDNNVQMIEMPYMGNNASMYISIDDGDIENYDYYISKLEETYIDLSLPKFKVEYTNEIGNSTENSILNKLGIKTGFNPSKANFSKMLENIPDSHKVYIDKVFHKTYINVDEKGTEAAAVTAVIMVTGTGAIPSPEPIAFIANKPFTFIISDTDSGEILFMGRYVVAE